MKDIAKLLASFSMTQRIAMAAAAVAVGVGVWVFANYRHESDFRPLYTGVAAEDAGAIVQKLREKNIPYRVGDHDGSIMVPSAKVAETRIELASAGLPKSGRIGFELFDKTKFGSSDLTERVNLRRAVEGELERSVIALSEVESARVHVTYPRDSVFAENRLPAKASVMVKLKTGRTLDEQSVSAVRFLVSSAVEGLAPEGVSVLDMDGHVLGKPKDHGAAGGSDLSDSALDYRRRVEKELLSRLNDTLEALVGPDRYRASVVAECDFTSGEQSEESFDPTRSVMTSSEKVKESSNASTPTGVPGTASNLPRPPSTQFSRANGFVRESENVAYQTAHTVKRIHMPEGKIVRLSASVLVDQTLQWVPDNKGGYRQVLTPPSADTLRRISEVVSGAIGMDPARGDRLVVDSLPFDSTLRQQPPAPPAPPPNPWTHPAPGVVIAVLLCAVLLASGAVMFNKRRKQLVVTPAMAPQLAPGEAPAPGAVAVMAGSTAATPAAPVTAEEAADEAAAQVQKQLEESRKRRAFEKQKLQAAGAVVEEILKELQESAAGDPVLCAGALRSWLTDTEPVKADRHGR
jgi:flagellar M-ring protein FliF